MYISTHISFNTFFFFFVFFKSTHTSMYMYICIYRAIGQTHFAFTVCIQYLIHLKQETDIKFC